MWREGEAAEVSWQELHRIRGVLARPCSVCQLLRQKLGASAWEVTQVWVCHTLTTRGWITAGETVARRAGLSVGFSPI